MAKSAHPPVIAAVTNESLKENSQSIMSSGNKHQSERVSDVERTSIWNRKLDSVYWVFFVVHVPIMLIIDLPPLYSSRLTPAFITTLRAWYIKTYSDRFFTDQAPSWFRVYLWMEAGYHLPLSLWAVGGLINDSPHVPLYLLPFALQTALTTTTCIAEMLSWPLPSAQKWAMGWLYVPYLFLALVMGLDMFVRLKRRLGHLNP